MGGHITEPDLRLFATLVRFDAVYYSHFKLNLKRISDYPNLSGYLKDIYQTPGVRETVDIEHIKAHYFCSHCHINPDRIIPLGSGEGLTGPHERDRFQKAACSPMQIHSQPLEILR